MLHKLKLTIITLGLASGMTAAALAYLHNVDTCRVLVLQDMQKHAKFQEAIGGFTQADFLTTLTRGR